MEEKGYQQVNLTIPNWLFDKIETARKEQNRSAFITEALVKHLYDSKKTKEMV